MTIEEKLKAYILSQYKSIREFSQDIEMPYTTIDGILKRGIKNSSVTNIIKICKELGISADALAEDRIVPTQDITKDVTEALPVMRMTISAKDLNLDGEALTDAEKETLLDAIDLCLEFIRRQR